MTRGFGDRIGLSRGDLILDRFFSPPRKKNSTLKLFLLGKRIPRGDTPSFPSIFILLSAEQIEERKISRESRQTSGQIYQRNIIFLIFSFFNGELFQKKDSQEKEHFFYTYIILISNALTDPNFHSHLAIRSKSNDFPSF